MPLTTLLVICWLYYENSSYSEVYLTMLKIHYTILPTIAMFFIFPYLIERYRFIIYFYKYIFGGNFCYYH